jgi:hypothetical protein
VIPPLTLQHRGEQRSSEPGSSVSWLRTASESRFRPRDETLRAPLDQARPRECSSVLNRAGAPVSEDPVMAMALVVKVEFGQCGDRVDAVPGEVTGAEPVTADVDAQLGVCSARSASWRVGTARSARDEGRLRAAP